MADVRETATKLWDDIGLQYMEENEEDLKKKTDFLKDVPTHYPDVKRPNLGCRTLVQCNIGKIVPAIGRGNRTQLDNFYFFSFYKKIKQGIQVSRSVRLTVLLNGFEY